MYRRFTNLLGTVIFIITSLLFTNPQPVASTASTPLDSAFFSGSTLENSNSYRTLSDGDLWPSCWSNDDNLYAANGDGRGFNFFSLPYYDIVVNRISGTLPDLSGEALANSEGLGQIWTINGPYNRKPTGMVCVDGTLYLAIQDLNRNFNDAPAASISKSTDHGNTWTWNSTAPMFDHYVFTTIMFLDYGKDSVNAPDNYVYAYGLDGNWRDSNNRAVPDPVDLYLARVPKTSIQIRSAWQFYSGLDGNHNPIWSPNIAARVSVLHAGQGVDYLSQGGVVYDKPLNRYIYSTWTEYTFEFYEAPEPWGPWTHFLSKDFGGYPWTGQSYGGYATTIPSKFISADGKTLWIQSNVCPCGDAGMSSYSFSLRRLTVETAFAS